MTSEIASKLLAQAKEHLNTGDYGEAIKAANGVLALDSGNSEASDILAASLAASGGANSSKEAPPAPVATPTPAPASQSSESAPETKIYEGNASVIDVMAAQGLVNLLSIGVFLVVGLWLTSLTGWVLFIAILYALYQLLTAKLASNNFHVKITSQRVEITTGILSKNFEMIELYRGKDTGVRQGFLQSRVDSGSMSLITDDATAPAVWFIVHSPRQIQEKVRNAVREQRLAMGTTARI